MLQLLFLIFPFQYVNTFRTPVVPQHVFQDLHSPLPWYNVTLCPVFDRSTSIAESLHITISLSAPQISAHEAIVELPWTYGNMPFQHYGNDTGNPITASDDLGALGLKLVDDNTRNLRCWIPDRSTEGDVELHMLALPREVDIYTPIGPRVDLRQQGDGTGLLGAGLSMLPVPPGHEETEWLINFRWDLAHAPPDVVAASSLGDEEEINLQGSLEKIQLALFAVGQTLHRYSPFEQSPEFALYYFGDEQGIPFDIEHLTFSIFRFYRFASAYFFEPENQPYCVFLRHSPRAFGGASFLDAFLLEYYAAVNVTQRELELTLMHEIVHNCPRLQPTPSAPDIGWYNEGIAEYYKIFIPHRFGLWDQETFLKEFNKVMVAYYTSPAIQARLTNDEAQALAWSDPDAQRVPYLRGFVFLFALDQGIRYFSFLSDLEGSLDFVAIPLVDRRERGLSYDLEAWASAVNDSVGGYVGSDADGYTWALYTYSMMSTGGILALNPTPWNEREMPFELNITSLEILELGFNHTSFTSRVIQDVESGSRAEEAGLRDGDVIVESPVMYWQVADDIEKNMTLRLRREGVEWEVTYWPRSREKVECLLYKTVEVHRPPQEG